MEAFEFVVVSVLRAQQLMKGCVPHLDGTHKAITMAQMEVSAGMIAREISDPAEESMRSGRTLQEVV
jgi:DNA-directed RNA polymerase subunit K/omega